jgi:hypothetical protein
MPTSWRSWFKFPYAHWLYLKEFDGVTVLQGYEGTLGGLPSPYRRTGAFPLTLTVHRGHTNDPDLKDRLDGLLDLGLV